MSKAQAQKAREAAAGTKRKLSRAEQKQIAALIRQAKGDGKAHTAQQTIPYLQMYPDGICRITEKKYSKSVVFEDINYQLAQADDKTAIFENWCDFLNYFDASVSVQLSFINQGTQRGEAERLSTFRRGTTLSIPFAQSIRICSKTSFPKATTGLSNTNTSPFPLKRTAWRRQKPALPVSKRTYSIILRCWA